MRFVNQFASNIIKEKNIPVMCFKGYVCTYFRRKLYNTVSFILKKIIRHSLAVKNLNENVCNSFRTIEEKFQVMCLKFTYRYEFSKRK